MISKARDPLYHPPFSTEVTLKLDSPIELVEDDGEPLETSWHRYAMNVLIDSVEQHLLGRKDFYVGGNMFIYYNTEQAKNRDYRGPDFFFVNGRPLNPPRKYWAIWEEAGRFPNVIVELMSSSTRHIDLGVKRTLYEKTFRTGDYFCYDPDTFELFGWTLTPDGYVELMPNDEGRLWCEELQLWIGTHLCKVGSYKQIFLRFFRSDGTLVLLAAEAAQAEAERAQANADRERLRAEAAEAELATLKAALARKDETAP
jgi:Uma2 family endonuclease